MVYCGIFSINELIDVNARRSSNQCSSTRQELKLDLDKTRLRKLTEAHEQRLAGTLPEWSFKEPGERSSTYVTTAAGKAGPFSGHCFRSPNQRGKGDSGGNARSGEDYPCRPLSRNVGTRDL